MNRTRVLTIIAIAAVFVSLFAYVLSKRDTRTPSASVSRQAPSSSPDVAVDTPEIVSEEPVPATLIVAKSGEAADFTASQTSAPSVDELEALRTQEVERFLALLRENGPSALQMRYWDEMLKLVLEDARARLAFEQWLFDRASRIPDDYRTLMAAMDSLKRAAPDLYTSLAERAIAEGNAPLLAAAVHHIPIREPEWIENLLAQALSIGDPVARYYAAAALNERSGLSPDVRAELLREVLAGNGADPGAEQQAFWQMGDLLTQEDYDLFESQFTQSSDPTVRYFARGRLVSASMGALDSEPSSSRDTVALDMWADFIDFMRDGLNDPDPLVRFGFAVQYAQERESIQADLAILSQLARSGVSIREYAEQH